MVPAGALVARAGDTAGAAGAPAAEAPAATGDATAADRRGGMGGGGPTACSASPRVTPLLAGPELSGLLGEEEENLMGMEGMKLGFDLRDFTDPGDLVLSSSSLLELELLRLKGLCSFLVIREEKLFFFGSPPDSQPLVSDMFGGPCAVQRDAARWWMPGSRSRRSRAAVQKEVAQKQAMVMTWFLNKSCKLSAKKCNSVLLILSSSLESKGGTDALLGLDRSTNESCVATLPGS